MLVPDDLHTRVSSGVIPRLAAPLLLTLAACGAATHGPTYPARLLGVDVCARTPAHAEESTFFASVEVEDAIAIDVPSNGDLWPSCSMGDTLFAAWGDGYGFDPGRVGRRPDIGVARIRGLPMNPASLRGENLVTDRHDLQATFRVRTRGRYYQKPTGMLCRGGRFPGRAGPGLTFLRLRARRDDCRVDRRGRHLQRASRADVPGRHLHDHHVPRPGPGRS